MTYQATMAAESYLRRVRAELADLPVIELDEVIQETAAHLAEVSDELATEASLETRLGSPREYADQLRSAAGYPPRSNDYGPTSRGTAALVWLALSTVLTPLLLIPWFALDSESSRAVFTLLAIGLAPAALSLRALRGHAPSVVTDTPLWRRNKLHLNRLTNRLWLLVPLNSLALLAVAILLIGGTSAWDVDGYNFSGVHHTHL
ncbi:hypothetical protein [Kribbella sp. NPDC006257]|uniref:DUF1700 domain-containing protein n=1 Tax=Kribbella sp. NPDC006257 TaxID=3156738 RepID=UPI0033A8B46F